jgi:hypothetical protein
MDYLFLGENEILDTSYGFINSKGIEVCSDSELDDI